MKHYDQMDPKDRLKAEIGLLADLLNRLIAVNGPLSEQLELQKQLEECEAQLSALEEE